MFGYSVASTWDEGIEDFQGRTGVQNENYDVLMTGHYGVVGLD
jgi:hypothetical protein